tara:strand:+ start:461 stop:601 length:141 start_codon:yes stop_codon:yes gene_type:complete
MDNKETVIDLLEKSIEENDWQLVIEAVEILKSNDSNLNESVFEHWG